MSEPISTKIAIGGTLCTDKLEEFVEAIEAQGVGADWGCSFRDSADIRDYLLEKNGAEPIEFYDEEANYGNMDDLTSFCRKNRLSYILFNVSNGVYDAGFRVWEPGMQEEKGFDANQEEFIVVTVDAIKEIISNQDAGDREIVETLRQFLKKHELPTLPKFMIDDDYIGGLPKREEGR